MRFRPRYITMIEAVPGMVLAEPLCITNHGALSMSLPSGHTLTRDSLQQLRAHRAEFMFIKEPDVRPSAQISIDAARAAHCIMDIFQKADLSDQTMASLFDQVLIYRSK